MLSRELGGLGRGYGQGVIVTQVVPHPHSSSTGVLGYRSALQRYYPEEEPGFASLEGYIVAEIAAAALRRAGPPLTRERLVDALESMGALDFGLGASLSFGPSDHQGSDKVWGTVLDAEGRFQPLELA
jgi:ABC-type branched-subunit amino acid transport system substrate-binding protein